MVGEVVPAEAGELVVMPGEARADSGVVRDAAAKQVADEGFDGVGFVKWHHFPPLLNEAVDCELRLILQVVGRHWP